MIKLALVGKDISHSKSPDTYRELIDFPFDYQLLDYADDSKIPALKQLFESVDGINITTPYKKHFLSQVEMDNEVQKIGAINCIKKEDGIFKATNTDYLAVEVLLQKYLDEFKQLHIVMLGNGVMAKMSLLIFAKKKLSYQHFFRAQDGDLSQVDYLAQVNPEGRQVLFINSCSRSFVFNGVLDKSFLFWDYNYNFEPHLESLPARCHRYDDGLELLKHQAIEALRFWNFSA